MDSDDYVGVESDGIVVVVVVVVFVVVVYNVYRAVVVVVGAVHFENHPWWIHYPYPAQDQ